MNRILGLILVLCLSPFVFGQPETAEKEWKEGKEYYIHFVQGGNTIYGLTNLYKVSAEDLVSANPEVVNGLKVGQKLLIPVQSGGASQVTSENTHTVQKSETLYGISKLYGITMEEIIRLNPTAENGINMGQVLNLPAKLPKVNPTTINTAPKTTVVFSDSTINHTVLDHETLVSISKRFMVPVEDLQALNGMRNTKIKPGDVLKIPLKKEKITSVEVRKVEPVNTQKIDTEIIFKKKDAYSIVVLLPFNLDKNADAVTGIATEFLMGAQLALDSLEKLGLHAQVQVLDCPSDTVKLKALLNQKNFKDVDLIFGPFMGAALEITARWCLKNQVRMVNPLLAQTDVLKDNKFVYNAVTSDISLQQSQAKYIAKNHSKDQLILVKVGARDEDIYQAFRQQFMTTAGATTKQKLIEVKLEDIGVHLKKGLNTVFIVPTRDKVLATRFMNALHKVGSKSGSGTISVFGTKEWVNFDDIRGYYKNKYNFHFASANDFNYSYDATKTLLKNYRQKYNADLSKYGTQGFDVLFHFVNELLLDKKAEGVMNAITLKSVAVGSGFENKACFILKQEDFEIIKLAELND